MSAYYNFSQCVICRTRQNLDNYEGDFEVTMLLNTLYLNLMYILEKRKDFSVRPERIVPFLKENGIVNVHNNDFLSDDIVRCLRNALAHFNLEVANDPYNKSIEQIKLWSQNLPNKASCKTPCEQQKCLPKQYNETSEGEICTFTFTVEQLKQYVELVQRTTMDKCSYCDTCQYNPRQKK